jgi:hypothetical protein
MKTLVAAACGFALAASFSGCGSGRKGPIHDGESLMQEEIRLTMQLAEALESGADQAKIDELDKELAENSKKFESVPQAERDRLTQKYNIERSEAGWRAASARLKIQGIKVPDYTGKGGQK